MWTSPSAARARSRPSNLRAAVRASPSFTLSRQKATDSAAGIAMERIARTTVQSRTTRATQTETQEADAAPMSVNRLHDVDGISLGAFGNVETMTRETVDFLIHVLEDRKQELLGSGEGVQVDKRATYAVAEDEDEDDVSEEEHSSPAPEVARLQLDSTSNGSAHVTELVRSHSYEALVQLEGILEARHHRLMNDGLLEPTDDSQSKRCEKRLEW